MRINKANKQQLSMYMCMYNVMSVSLELFFSSAGCSISELYSYSFSDSNSGGCG